MLKFIQANPNSPDIVRSGLGYIVIKTTDSSGNIAYTFAINPQTAPDGTPYAGERPGESAQDTFRRQAQKTMHG